MGLPTPLALLAAGALQGLLEWLPVSSSGQVDLLLAAAGYSNPENLALTLHLGTGIAALLRYAGLVSRAARNPKSVEAAALLVPLVVGAPIAWALLHLVYALRGGSTASLNTVIGVLLVVTGLVLLYQPPPRRVRHRPGLRDLAVVGVLQGIAVLPGLSRSAVVTAYLLYSLRDPLAAVAYAFYTGLSAQLAAGAYGLLVVGGADPLIAAGLLVAAATGYAAIRLVEGLAVALRRRLPWFLIAYGVLIVALDITVRAAG